MKTFWLFVACALAAPIVHAQAADPAAIASYIKTAVYVERPAREVLPKASREYYKPSALFSGPLALPAIFTELPWNNERVDSIPRLSIDNRIYMQFYQDSGTAPMDLGTVSISKISLECQGTVVPYNVPQIIDYQYTMYYIELTRDKVAQFAPNSLVRLVIEFESGQQEDRFFFLSKLFDMYAIGNAKVGFWIPVSLLGTDFGLSGGGLAFTSMPITLAWGLKFYIPESSFFFGISAAAGLVWANQVPPSGGSTSDLQSFFLSKLGLDLFVDFSGYFYLGVGSILHFSLTPLTYDWVLLVGIGPSLLSILH